MIVPIFNCEDDSMELLYCRVVWMKSYHGNATERPQGGGKYNVENIGHEVHNYFGHDGKYYGFVEAGVNNSIHVEKLCGDKKADFADSVLVVWVARKPSGGQYIVGWYENATVYRNLQTVPDEVMKERDLKSHNFYNVFSEQVFLVPPEERDFQVDGMGHSNIWYGDKDKGQIVDTAVIEYIKNYGSEYEKRIAVINEGVDNAVGAEKDAIVKVRINQDKFRTGLLRKFNGKCCLCGVDEDSVLVASHIKPWRQSDEYEKLDLDNGLLLCPNHDRLFDKGFISFDDTGTILISHRLSDNNKIFMNAHGGMNIEITGDNREYIRYHRNNIFLD